MGAWGHEQTEIDALAALNPAELTRIAMEAIKPFYDPLLAECTQDAQQEWQQGCSRAG
jgi:hypothetical protein